MPKSPFIRVYDRLLGAFGAQGWWPLLSRAGQAGYDEGGYHPGLFFAQDLDLPARHEIALGAVLTQNTTWHNASRALQSLRTAGVILPQDLLCMPLGELESLISCSGYYRQKAKKLRILSQFLYDKGTRDSPERQELLNLWGIGPETADSILLYAYAKPIFVVDAYTKRIFSRLGFLEPGAPYQLVQSLFHSALRPSLELYQEYHALIVSCAKDYCRPNSCAGSACPLVSLCQYTKRD